MNNALLSGVSGMSAHQKMIDVSGNNLANINTMAFKASRVSFSELLSQTMKEATTPSALTGGTNPQQLGSGVGIGSIDRIMTQGSMISTGQPLDMAIEGSGYFVLNDGIKDLYTRVGAFAVDAEYYLVDPGTGYRVQRVGSEGVTEGFQDPTSDDIRIPYDVALPAKVTQNVSYTGNLSADEVNVTTNLLTSGMAYSSQGNVASENTKLKDLDQATTNLAGTISITGFDRSNNPVTASLAVDATTTVNDLLTAINTAFSGSTASIVSGEIRLADTASGYSNTDLKLSFSGTGSIELPKYFQLLTPGADAVKNTNIEIFDSQGIGHVLSAAFVKTNTPNQWDLVMTSLSGDVELVDRRISGIQFLSDGAFGGMNTTIGDTASFQVRFGNDPANTRILTVDFGTVGGFDGLSQFGGTNTVAPSVQDGYAAGWLANLSVTREGVLVGVFTNGVRRNIAAMKLATFQNPAGLEAIGGNYYLSSGNSGEPVPTRALSGGAGAVNGGSLEKSNVEVSLEFVNLIQAQNGFQANARTIRVATDMLRELTNLIR